MTGLAPSRVEIQTRLEQALAERVPVAVATVVLGGQVGAKLLILPEETLGSLGDATLDAAVQMDAPGLLAHERSETRPYRVAGHDVDHDRLFRHRVPKYGRAHGSDRHGSRRHVAPVPVAGREIALLDRRWFGGARAT